MTWTYLPDRDAPLDYVRFLCGDRDATDPLLSDEEIELLLRVVGSPYAAASEAAFSIAADFGRQVDNQSGGTKNFDSQRSKAFLATGKRLKQLAARLGLAPYAGGLSHQEKIDRYSDTDFPPPNFYRRMQEEPGTQMAPAVPQIDPYEAI